MTNFVFNGGHSNKSGWSEADQDTLVIDSSDNPVVEFKDAPIYIFVPLMAALRLSLSGAGHYLIHRAQTGMCCDGQALRQALSG